MPKRVGVFANTSHLYHAIASEFNGAKLSYEKYLQGAIGEHELYRAYAYGTHTGTEASAFIIALKSLGFETRYRKTTKVLRDSIWNVGIAIDIFRLLDRLDIVVIGSNDYDMIPLVRFVRERGVEAVVYAAQIPPQLSSSANRSIEISSDMLERKPCS